MGAWGACQWDGFGLARQLGVKGKAPTHVSLPCCLPPQDMRALALHLLPILGVCLLGVLLMLGSAVRRAKPKRE